MPDEIFKKFLEGQDVPTVVGVSGVVSPNGVMHIATIFVDYSGMASEQDRKDYSSYMEELWNKNDFDDGFDVDQTSETIVRVSSKKQMIGMSFDKGEQNYLKAPAYWVDCVADPPYVKEFYKRMTADSLWMVHLRTLEWSYIYVLAHPNRRLLHKYRQPKIDIHNDTGAIPK